MVECRVDDAFGRLCGRAQAVQVVHVAAEDLRPGTGERLGAFVRTAEPDHVMASADQFRDDRRAYETCSTRNEYSHVPILMLCEFAARRALPTLGAD